MVGFEEMKGTRGGMILGKMIDTLEIQGIEIQGIEIGGTTIDGMITGETTGGTIIDVMVGYMIDDGDDWACVVERQFLHRGRSSKWEHSRGDIYTHDSKF